MDRTVGSRDQPWAASDRPLQRTAQTYRPAGAHTADAPGCGVTAATTARPIRSRAAASRSTRCRCYAPRAGARANVRRGWPACIAGSALVRLARAAGGARGAARRRPGRRNAALTGSDRRTVRRWRDGMCERSEQSGGELRRCAGRRPSWRRWAESSRLAQRSRRRVAAAPPPSRRRAHGDVQWSSAPEPRRDGALAAARAGAPATGCRLNGRPTAAVWAPPRHTRCRDESDRSDVRCSGVGSRARWSAASSSARGEPSDSHPRAQRTRAAIPGAASPVGDVSAETNLLFFSRSERACSSSSIFFRSASLTGLLRG